MHFGHLSAYPLKPFIITIVLLYSLDTLNQCQDQTLEGPRTANGHLDPRLAGQAPALLSPPPSRTVHVQVFSIGMCLQPANLLGIMQQVLRSLRP